MTIFLKQSTASQEVLLGRFVDSTDGNTEETGLTIANTDIKLHKAGGTTTPSKNSGGATHISNGLYYAVLDATDTDTLGSLVIHVHVAGALSVKTECVVLAANVFDSLIGGSDTLDVQVTGMGAGVVTAAAIATDAIDADALADNAITAATFAADAITAAKVASDVTTEIQSGLATAAALSTVEGKIDTVDGIVDAILADTGTDLPGLLATIAGYVDTEVAAIKAKTDLIPGTQDGKTFAEIVLLVAAAILGKASGLDTTTATYRSLDDAHDRIVATVDADGNRTAVTLDASSP